MVGIDEVGRGCLAGPLLVVAARQSGDEVLGLADSKTLSQKQREAIFKLLNSSYEFGEGWVSPVEINRHGLASAMRLGIRRAISQLKVEHHEQIIMDGPINYLPKAYKNVQCIIDADATHAPVSAASIFAKVKRDTYMRQLAKKYQQYGFDTNVGYGTAQHLAALHQHGYLKNVHRRYFAPVLALDQAQLW